MRRIFLLLMVLSMNCGQVYAETMYKVQFIDNNKVISTQMVQEGSMATPPMGYEEQIKDFDSWDKDYSNIKSNMDIHAVHKTKAIKAKEDKSAAELFTESNSKTPEVKSENQKSKSPTKQPEVVAENAKTQYIKNPEKDSQYRELADKPTVVEPIVSTTTIAQVIIGIGVLSMLITIFYIALK